MKQTEKEPAKTRPLENGYVYVMGEDNPNFDPWSREQEPTVGDFANLRRDVTGYLVITLQIAMERSPSVYRDASKDSPYSYWYLLNGAVYSAPALYTYLRAFYPPPSAQNKE